MSEKLRQAIEQTVAILGPEAPLCSGCVEEWTEALRILRAALAEQPAEQEPVAVVAPWPDYVDWLRDEPPVGTKLYTAPQPAKPAEPVAYVPTDALAQIKPPTLLLRGVPLYGYAAKGATAVYTAPQPAKREPLTDREVGAIMEELNAYGTRLWEFARAIELAHGIGEQE